MKITSSKQKISSKEIYYFRQRLKNKIFQSILAYFADVAKEGKLTKKDMANLLGKDPAQITRWFSGPNNWTLDTISDLLLAMDAELKHDIVSLHDINQQTVNDMSSTQFEAFLSEQNELEALSSYDWRQVMLPAQPSRTTFDNTSLSDTMKVNCTEKRNSIKFQLESSGQVKNTQTLKSTLKQPPTQPLSDTNTLNNRAAIH